MTVIVDLERCDYLPVPGENLLAVGWLGRGARFETGPVGRDFLERLRRLLVNPWEPLVSLGLHECDLCQFNGPAYGRNLFVPHRGRIYVAPEAVLHYIETHWYRPPNEFISAVEQCPEMNSMAYKKALLENGGRSLIQALRGA